MDQAPLPKYPTSPLPRVPYLCKDDHVPYDGSDFLTYPARNGYPLLNADENTPFHIVETNLPSDDREYESFMQSWAFFGLLHQFFDTHGLFDAHDYLDQCNGGRPQFIHTRGLESRLREWRAMTEAWEQTRKLHEFSRLDPCFRHVNRGIMALTHDAHSGCNHASTLALLLIGESLSRMAHVVLIPSEGRWSEVSITTRIPMREESVNQMLNNGWCPSEISWMQEEYGSISSRLYLQRLRKPNPDNLTHDSCKGRETCIHMEIDHTTYQTRHTTKGCECESIGPDMSKIRTSLGSGNFPVLKVSGDSVDTVSLEVLPSDEPYVAITHVWADGLGNPAANTLPRCQILRLRDMLNGIRGQTFSFMDTDADDGHEKVVERVERRDLAVWCDTLCVPVGGSESTILAIAKLRDVYVQAAYVLILDRVLEETPSLDIDALEAASMVATSRWMRRLWTFQEGALSRKLLIRFADQIMDFPKTRVLDDPLSDAQILSHAFRTEISAKRMTLVIFGSMSQRSVQSNLDYLAIATCYRRASHAEDEAVCLATALGLDAGRVAAADPTRADRRMQDLWQQMSASSVGIPQTVVFADIRRLSMPGYRWAPASLQYSVDNRPVGELFGIHTTERGHLTPRGFRVKLPVWRVRLPGPPLTVTDSIVGSIFQQPESALNIRAPSGRLVLMIDPDSARRRPAEHGTVGQLLRDGSREWYIVCESEIPREDFLTRRALLACAETPAVRRGRPVLKTVVQLMMMPANPGVVKTLDAVTPHALALRRGWKVSALWLILTLGALPWLWTDKGMVGYLSRAMTGGGRWLVRQLQAELNQTAMRMAKLPDIALADQQDGIAPSVGPKWLKARILMSRVFKGDMPEVVASFDSTMEWIID